MIVPSFDRWRARLIAHTDGDSMGPTEAVHFSQVAPTVALMCPFERFDGNACGQLITYYLRTPKHALGACHRHLAHALDILVAAGQRHLIDPSDEDLLAPSQVSLPARAPIQPEDVLLARELVASGVCTSADFGTTSIHEGYGLVVGAEIVLGAEDDAGRRDQIVQLANQLGVQMTVETDGSVRLTSPLPDLSEEWICQNRALRELMRDALDENLDDSGYRYRAIADALPEAVDAEPRLYTRQPSGPLEVELQLLATTLERPRQLFARSADRRTKMLQVDRIPRPGDYVDLGFARYRIVASDPPNGTTAARATAVLDRIHRPSRN
jgi:hypothetical protein